MEYIIIEKGSLYEEEPILIAKDNRIWDDKKQPCPHCHSPIKIIHTRSWDLSTWEKISWTNPFELLIPYDAGCCHTGVCLKCLVDGISSHNIDTDSIKAQIIDEFENIPVFTNIDTCLLKNEGWTGAEGCIWTKGKYRLGYRENKNDGWNLNGNPVEFMEDLKETKTNNNQ